MGNGPEHWSDHRLEKADETAVVADPLLEDPASYYLNLGNTHYHQYLSRSTPTDLEHAITHYKKALEMDPKLSEGYIKLASALWDKGAIPLETALHYCNTATQLNPANGEANLFLGYFLRKAGKIDEAIQQFKAAITKSQFRSSKPRIALGVGLLHRASGQQELSTMDRLHMACQGVAQLSLGCLLLPTDKPTVELIQSALVKDFQIYSLMWLGKTLEWSKLESVSMHIYRWASEMMPHEPVFYHLLADLHDNNGQARESIHYYQRALSLSPNELTLHKKLGIRYYNSKDLDSAADTLERALTLDENDFDTLYHLGRVHTDRKEYIRALYYFKESFNRDPQNPYIHSHMAYLLFKLEDFDGAIQEYRLAVSYGQDDVWTSTVAQTLGVLYYQVRQDLEAAIAMFQLAYQLNPANLDSMAMLADLYFEQGNLEAAVEAYQFILTHEPNNAECYSYLGYLLWQMDRNEEAIQAYQKSIQLDPDNAISQNNLGVIYLDDYQDAKRAFPLFERALAINPHYTLACFNLGRSWEILGDPVQAANAYSEALALNGEHPELDNQDILERLDGLFKAV
jgi:tetratricopeptide (TPR) repeat protein